MGSSVSRPECEWPDGSLDTECNNKAIGIGTFDEQDNTFPVCVEHAKDADEVLCFSNDHDEAHCPLEVSA
jgi:hypothetical protein